MIVDDVRTNSNLFKQFTPTYEAMFALVINGTYLIPNTAGNILSYFKLEIHPLSDREKGSIDHATHLYTYSEMLVRMNPIYILR